MNILGIDFEDWYHPELIKKVLSNEKKEPTIINGLDTIIDWLRKKETVATFFVVGELIEYKPEMLDKILENGHEIAFHTMKHTRLHEMTKESFSEELKQFAKITNNKSKGFRAPTFSLDFETSWAIDCLVENNYLYDSSIVPVKTSMYGINNAEIKPYKISDDLLHNNEKGQIWEFPLSISRFLGKKLPTCGGFYLRTLPFNIIKNTIQNYEKMHYPAIFYIHSWELTPEYMPKIKLGTKDSFVTYHNLEKAMNKMNELVSNFKFTSFENFLNNHFTNYSP